MNSFKRTDFRVTSDFILNNFEEIQAMMKKSSETEMMLSQVIKQLENNTIHLTKIVAGGLNK